LKYGCVMSRKFKDAIDAGDIELVRVLLDRNAALASTPIGWGPMLCPCKTEPLHYLSDAPFNQLWNHGKQEELAVVLIEAGALVDGLPASGETPLHGAASLGEVGVAEVLIDHGANIEAVATYPGIPHGTPLDFAVHFGMVDVVDLLFRRGATVLSARMAAGAGQLDPIEREFDLLQQNNDQLIDVYRCAAICDRFEIVEYLLANGVDVNTDIDGASALHWSAWEAKPNMVEFLMQRGADSTTKDRKHNLTPFGWAKHRRNEVGPRWGHDEVMRVLVSQCECQWRWRRYTGCPSPAARSVASSGPLPAQQSASLPSMTTAGTRWMPRLFARLATLASCMSSTSTSQDGQAML
jgi:ankyrin repeat protein